MEVRLSRAEAKDPERLPLCCMRCGAATTQRLLRTFANRWPGSSGGGLLVEAFRDPPRSMSVYVPLCGRHANRWITDWLISGLVVAGLMIGVVSFYVYRMVSLPPKTLWPPDLLSQFILIGLLIVIIPAALALRVVPIGASRIEEDAITLFGVAGGFVEALRQHREKCELH
jgi:hypothetical protein